MIHSVDVINHVGEQLTMELTNPQKCGLVVKEITGLGYSTIDIKTINVALGDGSEYQSSRMQDRNIVFTLSPMKDSNGVEFNRQKIYRYFPAKQPVTMIFNLDYRTVQTVGYVENIEPTIFSQEEDVQVSVLCLDPRFYSLDYSELAYSGIHPEFEFPFSNESLTENLIEFGSYRTDTRTEIYYEGDLDSGLEIIIDCLKEVSSLAIVDAINRTRMVIDFSRLEKLYNTSFEKDDQIVIDTNRGKKSVRLIKNGVIKKVIGIVSRNSTWFTLKRGMNIFVLDSEANAKNVMVTFRYKVAYGGI